MNKGSLLKQTHEAMHQIQGMPEHGDAEHLNNRDGLPNRPLQDHTLQNNGHQGAQINHPVRKPKVLVGWQNKIARFFGMDIK